MRKISHGLLVAVTLAAGVTMYHLYGAQKRSADKKYSDMTGLTLEREIKPILERISSGGARPTDVKDAEQIIVAMRSGKKSKNDRLADDYKELLDAAKRGGQRAMITRSTLKATEELLEDISTQQRNTIASLENRIQSMQDEGKVSNQAMQQLRQDLATLQKTHDESNQNWKKTLKVVMDERQQAILDVTKCREDLAAGSRGVDVKRISDLTLEVTRLQEELAAAVSRADKNAQLAQVQDKTQLTLQITQLREGIARQASLLDKAAKEAQGGGDMYALTATLEEVAKNLRQL